MTKKMTTTPRDLVRAFRKRYDLKQHELAELLDVSTRTVAGWESDGNRGPAGNLLERSLRDLAREIEEAAVVGEGS